MTDLTAHDEAIAREAMKIGCYRWDEDGDIRELAKLAACLGRRRAPPALSSPEHDEALIAEARRRHGFRYRNADFGIYNTILTMSRAGWTPEPDPDEAAVRDILGACNGIKFSSSDFQAALAAYRQATRGEG